MRTAEAKQVKRMYIDFARRALCRGTYIVVVGKLVFDSGIKKRGKKRTLLPRKSVKAVGGKRKIYVFSSKLVFVKQRKGCSP